MQGAEFRENRLNPSVIQIYKQHAAFKLILEQCVSMISQL